MKYSYFPSSKTSVILRNVFCGSVYMIIAGIREN